MAIPSPRAGHLALVTGASSGIGAALARQLAARGHDLILVARRRERLESLAGELSQRYGVRVEVVPCDLAEADGRRQMFADISRLGVVDVLVLCAGFGMVGPYIEHDPERITQMVRTNVESTMVVAREYAEQMAARGEGSILFVSSMAGGQPMPNFAPYAATKAAVTSLAQAMHSELRGQGVTVTALCPGSVDTEFSDVAGAQTQADRYPAFLIASADQCAEAALRALERGRRKVVPRLPVRTFAGVAAHMPRRLWLPICRRMLA